MRRMWVWSMLVAVGVLSAGLAGCGGEADHATTPTRAKSMQVAASIFPVGDLATRLLEGVAEVTVLLPPGASPHGFELTPARVNELADADAVFVVGLGLDSWATQATRSVAPATPVLDFAKLAGIEGAGEAHAHHGHDHDDDHGHDHDHPLGLNPHVWLDPVLTRDFVAGARERLQKVYPEHADAIAANAETLIAEIDRIDAEYRRRLADVPRKQLVTFHDAFNRLAERYGLEVVATLAPLELNPGGEVPPRRLADAMKRIQELDLAVVYAEPQFPDAAATQIARSTGTQVLMLDPVGGMGRPGYDSYPKLMRSNLNTLVKGQTPAAR